jgi:hypothetical protein
VPTVFVDQQIAEIMVGTARSAPLLTLRTASVAPAKAGATAFACPEMADALHRAMDEALHRGGVPPREIRDPLTTSAGSRNHDH